MQLVCADEPPTLVIQGGAVFDAPSGQMVPDQTIVIEGGRIRAVVPTGRTPSIPVGARVIDGRGKYVIPGLIDAHVHLVHLAERTRVTGDEFLPLFLANGVTSVRSTGDAIVAEAGVARYAESHPGLCPRVFLASPLIDGDPPFHRDVGYSLTDPAKVPAFVDDMAAWNVTTLKIYVGTTRSIGQAVIREGHRHGMKVTGHLGVYSAQDAVDDGIDCLEHIWSVFNYSIPPEAMNVADHRANLDLMNPRCQALVKAIAENKVAVDPTLVVFEAIYLNDLPEVHGNSDLAQLPRRMVQSWEAGRMERGLPAATLEARRKEIQKYKELTGILYRAGVTLLAGTDSPEPYVPPGFSMHRELEMLVESGLPPAAAIRCATVNNAAMLNQSDRLGSLEAGKLADLVILSADPTVDIRNTRKIELVIRGGWPAQPSQILESLGSDSATSSP